MTKPIKNELILGRKATGLRDVDAPVLQDYDAVDVSSELNVIMRREDLEATFDYRHYITYVSVWNELGEVLVYRRTKQSGEQTLVGQASIGFGGHIELEDLSLGMLDGTDSTNRRVATLGIDVPGTLRNAIVRELEEEVKFASDLDYHEAISIFNENTLQWIVGHDNDTDMKHIGLHGKYVVNKDDIDLTSPIDDHQILGWMTPTDALNDVDGIENWSEILLKHFEAHR